MEIDFQVFDLVISDHEGASFKLRSASLHPREPLISIQYIPGAAIYVDIGLCEQCLKSGEICFCKRAAE